MIRYAFRRQRWGMIGFGLTCAISALVQAASFKQVAGNTPEARAVFARSMSALAAQLSYLLPTPHDLTTVAGYVQWRAWGLLPLVLVVWVVASATSAVRGDENKQLVDIWMAAGVSRARIVANRLLAFSGAALVVATLAAAGTIAGAGGDTSVAVDRLAGQALALWLFVVTCFALTYLVAQLPATLRAAQGLAAGMMAAFYLLDVAGRTQPPLEGLAWLSPFKWYEATSVLAPGGRLDVAGVTVSVAVTIVAGALAGVAFSRRDVRGPLLRLPARPGKPRQMAPSPLLKWPLARLLYRDRWLILGWGLGTVVMAIFMVGTARTIVDSLLAVPQMRALLVHGGADAYQGFVANYWFGIAQLLLAGLAIHLVSGWAADDTDGLLEAELSTPRHRWGVVLERGATAATAIAVVVAMALTAVASAIGVDAVAVVRASVLLIPFALTFAAVGAAGSVFLPRAIVGILGIVAFLSFLVSELAPLLNLPDWVANLSVFKLYGNPLVSGVDWNGVVAMVAIVVVGFGLATVLMQRREITR